jgi:hypothetical protein
VSAGSSSVFGLGGLPTVSPQLQQVIRTHLVGVALDVFPAGSTSAEAVARADPGGAKATLTFSKSGQTIALPPELAAKLVGPLGGSATVVVDIAGRGPDGSLAAVIRPALAAAPALADPVAQSLPRAESATFSLGAFALSQAAATPLKAPEQWANLAREIAHPALRSTSNPSVHAPETQQAFAHGLAALVPGAGVGFERAVALLAGMGPLAAQDALDALSRFPQAAGPLEATSPQWVAQQASAKSAGQVMWSGQAWPGAPAWVAVGVEGADSDAAREARSMASPDAPGVAWLRMRAEPPTLGPIDLWAVWLGAGSCRVRLRASPEARELLQAARVSFGAALASAKVELSIDAQDGS